MRFIKRIGKWRDSCYCSHRFDNFLFVCFFQEATQALIEATTTPRHHHVQENDDDELDDEENNMNGEHSTDLRDNDDEINDPVSLVQFSF